tara:strand:- start:767 stop:1135 length:369 start_codon:yes stop_codon:yes gene_type:complete
MKLILWMILCVVLPTSANATFIQWELGEEIAVASLCRDQKSIKELARADQVNEEAALKAFASLASRGLCVVFDQHRSFTVVKKLFKYKDFYGRNSFVLEVVNKKIMGFRGYVMAQAPVRPSI